MESPDSERKPELNPRLKAKARLPKLSEMKVRIETALNSKELPTTKQRIIEGIACGILAGIVLFLIV